MHRLRILTVLDYYLPGWKAGGPVRAIENLVTSLGDRFQFDIITRDRDLRDTRPYSGITPGRWQEQGPGRALYLSPADAGLQKWKDLLRENPCDLVYLNSIFSRFSVRVLALRRSGLAPRVPFLLAPRGELQAGALSLKPWRKRAFLHGARALRLYDGIEWQAATAGERDDILRMALTPRERTSVPVHVVPDLVPPAAASPQPGRPRTRKEAGRARLVFISRIARKKNLDYALRILSRVRGRVEFDVYGPIEDETYWRECQHLMARLPSTLTVRYCGVLPPTDVVGTFAQYDLFFFPTRGESFGYVVVESLLGGCPVLLSDQTPWQVGRANAGWNAPLQQPDVFAGHLETMVAMDAASFNRMSADARALGLRSAAVDAAVEASRRLFLDAAAGSASSPGVR